MEYIDMIYAEMEKQGSDCDVHLAIAEVAKQEGDISEAELLEIYDAA